MPAAAELASPPGSPRSITATRRRACARRSAMPQPITPPPMTRTSGEGVESPSIGLSVTQKRCQPSGLGYRASREVESRKLKVESEDVFETSRKLVPGLHFCFRLSTFDSRLLPEC